MSVVACPKCQEKVTLPPQAPPAAKVRCPLCGEHYELAEALATAPPMLEIVELPEGYEAPEAEKLSLAASSFTGALDRSVPSDDDTSDFRLQDDGSVATIEEAEPRFDEWGSTKSTAPVHESGESPVRREASPVRRKKKGANPLFHVVGIVLGGALAFPAAFLILLWLPGTLRRDPANIGPWLGENVPFIVPADLRAGSADTRRDAPDASATNANPRPTLAEASGNRSSNKNGKGGGELELDNRFDDALKNGNVAFGEKETVFGGFGGETAENADASPADAAMPEIDDPIDPLLLDSEPRIDLLESFDSPPATTTPESEPSVAIDSSEPIDPDATATPEPTQEPLTLEPSTPEPSTPEPVVDELAPTREALAQADEAFNDAASPAEKKSAALAMYRAAAELAAQLPQDEAPANGFETILSDPMKLQVVGVASGSWIDNADRGSEGVVLSGNVKSSQPAGENFEIRLELPSRDKREVVVIAPTDQKEGSRVFIAGRIVQNAKDTIGGYEGDATQAVDARLIQALGE